MLHLIWTKDNSTSTSEDGKEIKGDAKKQVNRIAKNFVEYVSISYFVATRLSCPRRTYEATLAQLMNLPKPQRRGVILILGMLALSKKDVLMDKVENWFGTAG